MVTLIILLARSLFDGFFTAGLEHGRGRLLMPGGFMYIDDYGSWGGARAAVLDWLDSNGWPRKGGGVLDFPSQKPRGVGHGALWLWKSNPYDPKRPFAEGGS